MPEWPDGLDPDALGAAWRPVPFRHFVVKVHSRCNLACDYCYLYEMADRSWSRTAKAMSPAVARETATRIGEHARTHGLDRWYDVPEQETGVRLFEDILSLLLGGPGRSEQIGPGPATVVVVDTDGSIEQVDTVKSAFDGAAATGMSVHSHTFDRVLRHPAVVARQIGTKGLSETCNACAVRDVCGGGYFTHRYRRGSGFLNPSVYCPDLMRVITHVRSRVAADLDAAGV
ncbi:hypothetical protein ACU686_42175 [Yinghuangia aomiensis]